MPQMSLRPRTDSVSGTRGSIETGSLPAQIHRALEEAIIAGELSPGSRVLPDEIAESYGVSRIPVREALSSLHEAGWIDIRPRYGAYVRARSRTEVAQLFEARAGIESELARLAAARGDDQAFTRLRASVARTARAAKKSDTHELGAAAVEFNAALRAAAGNHVLAGLSLTLEKRARFYFSPIASALGEEWVEGQTRLLKLLELRDADAAARSARRHIVETGEAVSRLLPSDAFTD